MFTKENVNRLPIPSERCTEGTNVCIEWIEVTEEKVELAIKSLKNQVKSSQVSLFKYKLHQFKSILKGYQKKEKILSSWSPIYRNLLIIFVYIKILNIQLNKK